MSESDFKWRPYIDSAPEAMSLTDGDREIMSAQCPLIFERVVECSFHRPARQWPMSYDQVIQHWYSRHHDLISPPTYTRTRVPACSDQYFPWYEKVTRRYIINPRIWAAQQGMQATQGHLPTAVLRSTLDVTGFPGLIDRPPPPPAPTRQRRGRTLITPPPPPLPHVTALGWDVPWPNPTVEEARERYLGPGWDGPPMPHSSHGHAFTATQDAPFSMSEASQGHGFTVVLDSPFHFSESSQGYGFTALLQSEVFQGSHSSQPTQGSHSTQTFQGYGFPGFGQSSVLGLQQYTLRHKCSYAMLF
ncbi:hypothetical protein POM88_007290 [Heracleum sosnowskyi]|uniref:Aminotransferase-like plant mobile domain-containing protein n=1 Tax=Heracleum sosnowskyi TaxID=360622 RepID=A0AAD8N646_9APIA|nr:hypothetical protein POM88_007290 [Heracleum sosnowskyi]